MPRKKLPEFKTAFGVYRAERALGEGGAGVVYAAIDDQGDLFAIKVLDPARATQDRLKRFKNEYLFGYRNQHPRLVRVVDQGLTIIDGIEAPFYVMPRYAESFRSVLRRGLKPEQALAAFAQILDGVEAAHLLNTVHRDLKPENILANGLADLVIADFGIARFEEEDLFTAVETRQGDRLANFIYAAPEQRRRGGSVDQRADIFALGLILNECFTGEVPQGTGYRLVGQVSPSNAWVDDVVAQLIQQAPSERPHNIAAVKALLALRSDQFLTRQKLSDLSKTVIEEQEIDDPLAMTPPTIVAADYDHGMLIVTLDRPVTPRWISALQNMGNYSFIQGAQPEQFRIRGREARVPAREYDAQAILDTFKSWLPLATQTYARQLGNEKREEAERRRAELQAEREELERRERVRSSLRI